MIVHLFILNFCIIECVNITQAPDVRYFSLKKIPPTYPVIIHEGGIFFHYEENIYYVRCLWIPTIITGIHVKKNVNLNFLRFENKSLSPSLHCFQMSIWCVICRIDSLKRCTVDKKTVLIKLIICFLMRKSYQQL